MRRFVYSTGQEYGGNKRITHTYSNPKCLSEWQMYDGLTFRRGPNNSIKTDDSDIMEKPGGYCGIPNPKGWVNLSTRRARFSVGSSKALRRARMSWNSYSE